MLSERPEWWKVLPVVGAVSALAYVTFRVMKRKSQVNLSVEKGNAKVVHTIDIEELGDRTAFCRCWRSKSFPKCDGSHNQHNEETGDNVGPVVINRKVQ